MTKTSDPPRIWVRATETQRYRSRLMPEGKVFALQEEADFDPTWMVRVEPPRREGDAPAQ